MSGPGDPDFERARLAARARLDAMDDAGAADPYRRAWFEAVYDTAGDDAAQIPWADLSPHPLLAAWLGRCRARRSPAHARSISAAGSATTRRRSPPRAFASPRFDLSPRAIRWAQSRFPRVDFIAADLFAPPPEWTGAFDLVHECYTLQALPDAPRARSDGADRTASSGPAARCVRDRARARRRARRRAGPPWPLSRDELMSFAAHGLTAEAVERAARSDRRQAALARGIPAR